MKDLLIQNLAKRFESYNDLIAHIDAETLEATLDIPRAKSVRDHLWCIVGTRQSYAEVIRTDSTLNWSCSVSQHTRADYMRELKSSGQAFLDAVSAVDEWTERRLEALATMTEHEAMHEGQIIRQVWGLAKTLPESCAWTACG